MKQPVVILFLLSLGIWPSHQGFSQALSIESEISIVTCGPGQQELYAAFGHSAIRVYDPQQGIDWIYNYGIFDFDQPNFYLNFAKGYLYYKLGVMYYDYFEQYYRHYNRFIHEQVLDLSQEQKQAFFEFLQWNALPENQYYRYDYFYDNCATRVRDALERVLGNELVWDFSFIDTRYTIRELTDLYLQQQPWGDLGIDLALGLPMDKVAAPREYMFLPDYVEYSVEHATWKGQPLVKEYRVVFEPEPEDASGKGWLRPTVIFWGLFLGMALLCLRDFRRKRLTPAVDTLWFGVMGLLGVFLLLLWLATDHQAAAKNFNLLWAFPAWVIAVPMMWKATWRHYAARMFLVITGISALVLVLWPFLPQTLHYSLVPLVGVNVMRGGLVAWLGNRG
jgi:hypothetical protein